MDYHLSAYLLLLLPFTSLFYACQGSSIIERRAVGAKPLTKSSPRDFYIAVGEWGYCGGFFFTSRTALTAAHCLHQNLEADIAKGTKKVVLEFATHVDIYVGDFIGNMITLPCSKNLCDKLHRVETKVFIHSSYVPHKNDNNDIAVLVFKLDKNFPEQYRDVPVNYAVGNFIWNVCSEVELKAACLPPNGITNIASCGLGIKEKWFSSKKETPNKLQELDLKEPFEWCKNHEESKKKVKEFQILGKKDGTHLDYGDSGSPVYLKNASNVPTCLYGIVKGGRNGTGAYAGRIVNTITEIDFYRNWIRQIEEQIVQRSRKKCDPETGKFYDTKNFEYVWLQEEKKVEPRSGSFSSSGSLCD